MTDRRDSELLRLELRLARRDLQGLDLAAVLADDFLEIGRSGETYTKSEAMAVLSTAAPTEVEILDLEVRRPASTVFLVTYRPERGEPGQGRLRTLRSSIWLYRGDRPQLLFHQGTPSSVAGSPDVTSMEAPPAS